MKKWAFRIACILLIIIEVALIIRLITFSDNMNLGQNTELVWIFALGAIALYVLCLKSKFAGREIIILFIIASIITVVNSYIYIRFLPKYEIEDTYKVLQSKPEFRSHRITYRGGIPLVYKIQGNPFVANGYILFAESVNYTDNRIVFKTRGIYSDPVTGAYQVCNDDVKFPFKTETVLPLSDLSFSQQAVLFTQDNTIHLFLYVEETSYCSGISFYNDTYTHWLLDPKNSFNPKPSLKEDEVAQLLDDLGRNKLETNLKKSIREIDINYLLQVSKSKAQVSDIVVDVMLYGVHVGTYQNGNITLAR